MKIEKFLPSAALVPFIKAYMIIESEQEMPSRILPDTSVVMAFRYRGQVLKVEEGQTEVISASVITGLRRSARQLHYVPGTANLLVVLNEGGMSAFARIPAHEWFDQTVAGENVFLAAEVREILERLAGAKTHRARIDHIEAFLLRKLLHPSPDLRVEKAIQVIQQHNGLIRIKALAASLHISQDPLEKRFRTLVGSTPKQYASIVRLRNLISQYPAYSSFTDASYAAGYFDQAHFIKDFRQFTGQAPKAFFQSSRYW